MGDEQYRGAVLLECIDHMNNILDREHIDARIGLIEDRELRVQRKGRSKFDPLAFTSAQAFIDHPVHIELRRKTDELKVGCGIGLPVFHGEVISDRDPLEPNRLLPCHGNAEQGTFIDRKVIHH